MLMWLMIAGLLLGAGIGWLVPNSKFKLNWFELVLAVLGAILILLAIENNWEKVSVDSVSFFGIPVSVEGIVVHQLFAPMAAVLAVVTGGLVWMRQGKEPTSAQINGQPQTDVAESEKRPTPDDRIDDSVSESSIAQTPGQETIDKAPTDVPEPEKPRRSAVDEIKDLSKRIHRLQAQVGEIDSFARASHSKLTLQADEHRRKNLAPTLAAFMRIYNQLFRKVRAMEGGGVQPDQFILGMLPAVETELEGCGVSIIRPHPGDTIDLEVMTLIGFKPTPFWRRGNRVAQLEKCGHMLSLESGNYVLEKAEVVVYRDKHYHDGLEGDTNDTPTNRN